MWMQAQLIYMADIVFSLNQALIPNQSPLAAIFEVEL